MIAVGKPCPGAKGATCVLLVRKGKSRSKYFSLVCFGAKRHYRKDGTCVHTDEVIERTRPDCRYRVKVDLFGGKPRLP